MIFCSLNNPQEKLTNFLKANWVGKEKN
jgi:hypothetical protein